MQQISDFDMFTLDDIDAAFQNVIRLKYSQNYHLSGYYFSSKSLPFFPIHLTIGLYKSFVVYIHLTIGFDA
jgi:Cft2 family RNA processing exonuclease